MNTRKNRKRTWKVQEQEFETPSLETETPVKKVPLPLLPQQQQQQQQDSNRLLLFLQSWQEAKEAQVNGTLRKDMPESIADLMAAKGYPISVNIARTKIMNFIKKYNLVKKMAASGKTNEWTHFNTVKKILEFGPPILPSANVAIPMENIKLEEKASLKAENTLKIAERKVSIDAQIKSGPSKSKDDIDLIEIGDDDTHLLKPRVYFSESEHIDDESDDSDMSDVEDPLADMSFPFQTEGGPTPQKEQIPKMPKLEKSGVRLPALNKIQQNHIKQIPNVVPQPPPVLRPSNQPRIIPITPKPGTTSNGAPQQFLIVRPLTPHHGKTLAIPMGGDFKFGPAPISTPTTATKIEGQSDNQMKIIGLPKIPAQITAMTNNQGTDSKPPPLVSTRKANEINGQGSPCSSPNSASSPTVRQLLNNVISLETNIYKLQQERLQLERERFEMERDYGKEMLNVFREIKDKLCDIISVPSTSANATSGNTLPNSEVDNK